IFFDREIHCTYGLLRTLDRNEIRFEECTLGNETHFLVPASEMALLYDIAMNVEVLPGMPLPFILANHEFENAIVYSTRVERSPIVRINGKEEYHYVIKGPLYSEDYHIDGIINIKYIN